MDYKGNIVKLYVLKGFRYFLLVMPVILPFFKSKGLNMTEIMLLQSIFSMAIVFFEVPTGYLGDLFGRKLSISVGLLLSSLGFFIMAYVDSFQTLIIAEIVLALATGFISGSDIALLYDSLSVNEREKHFVKYQGRMSSTGNFSEAAAGILGGFLAVYSLSLPCQVHAVILLCGFFLALTLKEPEFERMEVKSTGKNFKDIFVLLRNTPILKWYIVYAALTGVATITTAWLAQAYFIEINIDLSYYGILWTILNLVVGIGAILSDKIYKTFDIKLILITVALFVCLGLPAAGYINTSLGIIFILFINFFRGIKEPIIQDKINQFASPEKRATILSLNSFFFRLGFALLSPLAGYMLDVFSFKMAMSLYFIPIFVFTLISVVAISKNQTE